MNSFELLDVFLFIGVSQGLFLSIALQTVTNKNKSANKILSILLFIAAFMLFGRILYLKYTDPLLRQIAFSADTVIFIFGPLVYLYIRRLTFFEQKKYRLSFYHYIPAIVLQAFIIWSYFYTPEEFKLIQKTYHIDLIFKYRFIQISAITSHFYYLYKSYKLVKSYQKQEKKNLSYSQNITSFLKSFITIISVIILLWLIGLSNKLFKVNLSFINYDMIWISIPVFVYFVGFYSLNQPEVFRIQLKTEKKKITKKRLDEKVLLQLQEKLNLLMQDEKIYLDNQLTLRSLAEKLNTSSNNLSWLLNSVYNCTFYEYINRSRIKTFISKIENGEHKEYTVLALSIDSGFNSKSTFHKAFKAEMNDTPTNYIKNLNIN